MERKSVTDLQKQIKLLKEEENISKKFTEDYKFKISQEIKQLNPKDIKNTQMIEEKYSLWQRLKKVLKIN
jgi:hypothetical protein